MAPKLKEIRTQYHSFVDDQVLTAKQLNGLIEYFEDQDRLSRVLLTGVGIICGLEIKKVTETSFTLTQGVGVTTDGDVLTLREITYTHGRKFDDKSARYPFFTREGSPIELLEALPTGLENSEVLEKFSDWREMCVLLYLEAYANEADLCTTMDCDNQGVEQVGRLRVLLVSLEDAAFIAEQDSLYSTFNVDSKLAGLPEITMRRLVLSPANTKNYETIKEAYHEVINRDRVQEMLVEGVQNLYADFAPLLELESEKNRFNSFPDHLKKLVGFTVAATPADFQYRYHALKDLIACWNQIRESLAGFMHVCFPDFTSFPKHLLLGRLSLQESNREQFRHRFYRSSALAKKDDAIKECRNSVLRLLTMVEKYQIKPGEIRITPSNLPSGSGQNAVPFYYAPDESLLKIWNGSFGYHREKLSKTPRVQDPLAFDLDSFNFFRIEGHQGKERMEALEEIMRLRNSYGLAFDVKLLSLDVNSEELGTDEYEAELDDLDFLLRAWNIEQACVLAEASTLFSGFSTKTPGKNAAESMIGKVRSDSFNYDHLLLPERAKNMHFFDNPLLNKVKGVVKDNLVVEDETVGLIMHKALDHSGKGSVNDIIAHANRLVKESVDETAWAKEPDTKEFVFKESIELMAYVHVLSQSMPTSIAELNTEKITNYKLTLKELCALVDKLKVGNDKRKLSQEMKAITSVLISHLSGICCSAKKLDALKEEMEARKLKFKLSLQLSRFVEQHPGLEHKAGVTKGGTFVLVYATQRQRIKIIGRKIPDVIMNKVIADFMLPYRCCSGKTSEVVFTMQQKPEVEQPRNCNEQAISGITNDLEVLKTLELPESNFVVPIWQKTMATYGKGDEAGKGVLDDVDKWLAGDHNTKLTKTFSELFLETSTMIIEISERFLEEAHHLTLIFVLQLKLFYHVLGCQSPQVLEKHADRITKILEEIYATAKKVMDSGNRIPTDVIMFLEEWVGRMENESYLMEHAKKMIELIRSIE